MRLFQVIGSTLETRLRMWTLFIQRAPAIGQARCQAPEKLMRKRVPARTHGADGRRNRQGSSTWSQWMESSGSSQERELTSFSDSSGGDHNQLMRRQKRAVDSGSGRLGARSLPAHERRLTLREERVTVLPWAALAYAERCHSHFSGLAIDSST